MEKVQFVKTFGGRISILLDRIHGHILLPTALSLALSLRAATNLPLSHDEFYTRHAIQEGLDLHLWEAPSLPYYVVQWIATGGGALDSDLGLRLVSVIAVAVTVACVAEAARQMASKTSAYIAGFLMALSGVALTRAAEARPYALGLSIFVISFLLLLRMMRQQNRSSSLAYGTSLVLGLLIMPQGIVVLIPHALIVLQRDRNWDRLKRWALSVLPAAFLVLVGATVAWLNVFPNMHNWLDSPTVTQFVDGLLWVGGAGNSRPGAGSAIALALIVLGLTSNRAWLLTCGAILGAAGLFLGSQGGTSFWTYGSSATLVPIVIIGASIALGELRKRSMLLILATFLIVSLPIYADSRMPRSGEADIRQAVMILEQSESGPVAVFGSPAEAYGLWAAIRYYGLDSAKYTPTKSPEGEYWSVYGSDDCRPLQSWDVGGQATLKWCAAPGSK
jgi:uncharacterized membrane protein